MSRRFRDKSGRFISKKEHDRRKKISESLRSGYWKKDKKTSRSKYVIRDRKAFRKKWAKKEREAKKEKLKFKGQYLYNLKLRQGKKINKVLRKRKKPVTVEVEVKIFKDRKRKPQIKRRKVKINPKKKKKEMWVDEIESDVWEDIRDYYEEDYEEIAVTVVSVS